MHPQRAMRRMLGRGRPSEWSLTQVCLSYSRILSTFSRKPTALFMWSGDLFETWGRMEMALYTTCWRKLLTATQLPKSMWQRKSAWATVMQCLRRRQEKTGKLYLWRAIIMFDKRRERRPCWMPATKWIPRYVFNGLFCGFDCYKHLMRQQLGPIYPTYATFCSFNFCWLESQKNIGCLSEMFWKLCVVFSSIYYWLNWYFIWRG